MRIEVKGYSPTYKPIIYRGGALHIHYKSETGKFNFLSDDESTMCHIRIYEDGKRIGGKSVDCESDYYDDCDVDEALWLIDEDAKMHWIDTAREEKQAVRNFIAIHRDEIGRGNILHEISQLTKDIESKASRLEYLTSQLADQNITKEDIK